MNDENKNLIEHFDTYQQHPIVKSVLRRETTFANEVAAFYDMETWIVSAPRIGTHRVHEPHQEDPAKRGRMPTDLVDLITPFSEQTLDVQKLSYEAVRKDYARNHTFARETGGCLLPFVSGGLGASAMFAGSIAALGGTTAPKEFITYAAVAGTVAVLGAIAAFKRGLPKGSNDEYGEYHKLYESAERADSFVNTTYRQTIVNKLLE